MKETMKKIFLLSVMAASSNIAMAHMGEHTTNDVLHFMLEHGYLLLALLGGLVIAWFMRTGKN